MNRNSSELIDYIAGLYNDPFIEIRDSAPKEKNKIQVSCVEGKLIYLLIKMYKASKVLELGTLAGYSTAWISKACKTVVTIEKDEKHHNIAKANFEKFGIKNITPLLGDANELLKQFHQDEFDAIFIDADKKSYPKYLEATYPLLRKGGLLLADNTLLWSDIHNEPTAERSKNIYSAIRNFNIKFADENKFESIIIPTFDGLSICLKK